MSIEPDDDFLFTLSDVENEEKPATSKRSNKRARATKKGGKKAATKKGKKVMDEEVEVKEEVIEEKVMEDITLANRKRFIDLGRTVFPETVRKALGHSEAFDYIYKLAKEQSFTENDIKKLHKLFYRRIDEDKAGGYRKERVFISGSKYPLPAPEKVSALMVAFIKGIKDTAKKYHPVEYSAIAHKELVFIHPFIDGNGRVARLLMNLILLQTGYCIALIPPILRRDYIQALEKAHTDDKEFKRFIAKTVLETQKDYLRLLQR